MKIRTNTKAQGSVLMVTLLTAFIFCIALASYLSMVSSQNQSVMRSLTWNSAIPVVEAGIEEALTQVYFNGITNLTANGWTFGSDGFYHKTRDLGNGYSYNVLIKALPQPVIDCVASVPAPANFASYYSTPFGMILGGVTGQPSSTVATVKRRVQVVAKRQTPFTYAMLAKGQVDLKGNGIATDSFDSADPLYSTLGKYDPAKNKANGDIATNQGLVNSINSGNADIMGHVHTGPNGTISIGPNGSVGDKAWISSGQNGIEPGFSSDDSNIDIPGIALPFTSGYSTPVGGGWPILIPTNVYTYILGSGNYQLSSFSGKVLVTGNAVLVVTTSFTFNGQDSITIAPGASLKVYVQAASASLGGNGVINNNGDALAFQYYGLNSNTSVDFGANAAFTGVVYAPNADFSLGGGGNNTYDFVGASVTKSVTMNGHFHFHYDENIARRAPIGEYVVFSWNELNPYN